MEFIVMDMDSPYNAILGRGWLTQMKAIASPMHQKLKFPSKTGVVVVRGKQEDARHYFRLAVQSGISEKRPAELAQRLQTGKKKSKVDAEKAEKMEVQQAVALVAELVEAEKIEKCLGKKKKDDKPESSTQRQNGSKNC